MSQYVEVDFTVSPPRVSVPRAYNAAVDFIDRNAVGDGREKTAIIDDTGGYTYAALSERVNRAGNMLRTLGVQPEQRVMMCMADGIDFPAVFFGAIKIGAVAVPVNTLLTTSDYDFMLRDSRAPVLVVSAPLLEKFEPILAAQPRLRHVLVAGGDAMGRHASLAGALAAADTGLEAAETSADDVAFWLYSSGSTGQPKGAVHLQSDMAYTAALYGVPVLGIGAEDVVFSAAKLFFAYGLGNALTFPLYVGATAVLMAERPTPQSVMRILKTHQPTIFYGVPTLYAAILAQGELDRAAGSDRLRLCVSAGEPLPADIGKRWLARFGVDILDGLGSTEMLHIFLSNRPGAVSYGTTGQPVPGYEMRVVDDFDEAVADGDVGDLLVRGPTSAPYYWNNRKRSIETFQGPWTRTGDKYLIDPNGNYVYAGRSDDMMKVGGIWVSPFEVESALGSHASVLEAAVVGQADADELIKPKAYVVLQQGESAGEVMAGALQQHVKDQLAPYKYPRWIEFVDALPKTATGKIQRFKLRD